MRTKNFAQCLVQEMGCTMVGLTGMTPIRIHASHEIGFGVLGHLLGNMYRQPVLTLRIYDIYRLKLTDEYALITNLSAHFCIEGGMVDNYLIVSLLLLNNLANLQHLALIFRKVPSYKLAFAFSKDLPVIRLNLGSSTCAFFLFLHLLFKAGFINCQAVFTTNQFRQVQGEAIGIKKSEGLHSIYFGFASSLCLCHHAVEQFYARFQRAKEALFLFLHHLCD